MGGANRECQVGGRAGGRSGAGGGWANVKVGNAGGACRSSTWATEEGGQKQKQKKKKKETKKENVSWVSFRFFCCLTQMNNF